MPSVYQIQFLPGGEILELYGSCGDHYKFEDGSQINVISRLVWCHRCGEFTDGESIESLDEIDRLLADLHSPSLVFSQMLYDRLGAIERMEERRRWLSGRRSPPKCLRCGSTEIIVLPEGERAENPSGPGWIKITVTGHCDTEFSNRFYTPEGDRIPIETLPTYRTWPRETGGRTS